MPPFRGRAVSGRHACWLLSTGAQQQTSCKVFTVIYLAVRALDEGPLGTCLACQQTNGRPTFPRPPEQQPMARADLSWG